MPAILCIDLTCQVRAVQAVEGLCVLCDSVAENCAVVLKLSCELEMNDGLQYGAGLLPSSDPRHDKLCIRQRDLKRQAKPD